MARTGKAAVMGIDPYDGHIRNPVYEHHNLGYRHAGVEWAIKNHAGEVDLAVWSWPTIALKPLENLAALKPRAALVIFNMCHWRTGIPLTDYTKYVYHAKFDNFSGYRKALMWKGVDYISLDTSQNAGFFVRENMFVLYFRDDLDMGLKISDNHDNGKEYQWVTEARRFFPHFPQPEPAQRIDQSHVMCPPGEEW